jgi:type II secretory pathway component PulJ
MLKSNFFKAADGYTLMETLVAIFLFIIIVQGADTLYNDVIKTNTALTGNLNAQMQVRKAFSGMSACIRTAAPSANGAYAIDTASSSYFAFYSDIDKDGVKEKVRYFLSGNILKMGVIEPSGSPSTYNIANEKITTLISDISNQSSTPIFYYYDSSYNGSSAPLTMPINISAVRLIKIDVFIDHDPLKPPAAIEFTTQTSIRSLKDNL